MIEWRRDEETIDEHLDGLGIDFERGKSLTGGRSVFGSGELDSCNVTCDDFLEKREDTCDWGYCE